MLNELREYEQYTFPVKSGIEEKRLKHKPLCNGLSGITRAMTVIARKCYFSGKCEKNVFLTKNTLRVWCGDPKGEQELTEPEISYGWLPEYIVNVLGKEKMELFGSMLGQYFQMMTSPEDKEIPEKLRTLQDGFCIEAFRNRESRNLILDSMAALADYCQKMENQYKLKDLNSVCKEVKSLVRLLDTLNRRYGKNFFNKPLFTEDFESKDFNDFKMVSYDRIAADAVVQGPLKRYYLVCGKADFAPIKYRSKKKETSPFAGEWTGWTDKTEKKADLILKTTAACILEFKRKKGEGILTEHVPINQVDVINWTVTSQDFDHLKDYFIDNRPLVEIENYGNACSCRMDPQWMEECEWDVIPEEALDSYLEENPKAVFFSDQGSGKYLKRYTRYTIE